MPTYEYECTVCHNRFERKQKFSEEPIKVCPECSGPTRRVLYPAGIIFKGSGWYITDSRGGSSGHVGIGESSSSETKSNGASKTDSKSESTAASTAATSGSSSKSEASGGKDGK